MLHKRRDGEKIAEERLAEFRRAENARIGRELHDGLGGNLTGIRYLMDSATGIAQTVSEDRIMNIMRKCSDLLQESQVFIRRLAGGFESRSQPRDFTSELQGLRAGLEATFSVRCSLCVDAFFTPFPDIAAEILQIIREALTNAVRHGHPGQVWIIAKGNEIIIENDGINFPDGKDFKPGIGLESINMRVRTFGGRFDIKSRPGGGSVCRIELPTHLIDSPTGHMGYQSVNLER